MCVRGEVCTYTMRVYVCVCPSGKRSTYILNERENIGFCESVKRLTEMGGSMTMILFSLGMR